MAAEDADGAGVGAPERAAKRAASGTGAASGASLDGPPGTAFVLRLLAKPPTIVLGAVGSVIAGRLSRRIWTAARHSERPAPGDLGRGVLEVAAAAALEGAILAATRALVERARAAALAWLSDGSPRVEQRD